MELGESKEWRRCRSVNKRNHRHFFCFNRKLSILSDRSFHYSMNVAVESDKDKHLKIVVTCRTSPSFIMKNYLSSLQVDPCNFPILNMKSTSNLRTSFFLSKLKRSIFCQFSEGNSSEFVIEFATLSF